MRKNLIKIYFLIFFLLANFQLSAAKPYVTAGLLGQLGNQMFQLAAAISLALDNDAEAHFPELATRLDYGIRTNYKYVFWRLNTSPLQQGIQFTYQEPAFTYSKIPYKPQMKINGYFTSEKYFKHHKKEVCALFAPSKEILQYLEKKYPFIIHHPQTVSIHLRTYFKEDPAHTSFSFSGDDYLKKAVAHFPEDSLFVVFSDEIQWCKENLKHLAKNICFIEGEHYYYDFYLISLCKHNIISNSTFSWWSAYLNQNPEKIVIAPGKWFEQGAINRGFVPTDIIPEDWFVLF